MKRIIFCFLLIYGNLTFGQDCPDNCTIQSMLHHSWDSVNDPSFYYTFTAENKGKLEYDDIPDDATQITVGDYTYTFEPNIESLPDEFMSEDKSFVISTFQEDRMDYTDCGVAVRVEFFDPESELCCRVYVTFKRNSNSCYWVGVSQLISDYKNETGNCVNQLKN